MAKSKLDCKNASLLQNKEWLNEQYIVKNLSLRKIARLIPCSSLTVRRAIAKFGIEIKPVHFTYGDVKYPSRHAENNPRWGGGRPKCLDCGAMLGSYKAIRCVKCKGIAARGENNPCWLPPELRKSTELEQLRNSVEYDEWRFSVYKRYGNKCAICAKRIDPMAAHHLDGFNAFPEKRFDVDNGVALCTRHHVGFHAKFGFGKNTKAQFEEYAQRTTEVTF